MSLGFHAERTTDGVVTGWVNKERTPTLKAGARVYKMVGDQKLVEFGQRSYSF